MNFKIDKKDAKEVGIQAGGLATGIVGGHAALKVIPKINDTVDMIVPFGVAGVATTGAMMVKHPFAKAALVGLGVFSFFKGTSIVVNKLSTPNAEGKVVISENMKAGIDYVLPQLGNDVTIPVAGIGMIDSDIAMLKPTLTLAGDEPFEEIEDIQTKSTDDAIMSLVG